MSMIIMLILRRSVRPSSRCHDGGLICLINQYLGVCIPKDGHQTMGWEKHPPRCWTNQVSQTRARSPGRKARKVDLIVAWRLLGMTPPAEFSMLGDPMPQPMHFCWPASLGLPPCLRKAQRFHGVTRGDILSTQVGMNSLSSPQKSGSTTVQPSAIQGLSEFGL